MNRVGPGCTVRGFFSISCLRTGNDSFFCVAVVTTEVDSVTTFNYDLITVNLSYSFASAALRVQKFHCNSIT